MYYCVPKSSLYVYRNKHHDTGDTFKGKFCFIQTQLGKVVEVYHGHHDDPMGINLKRGIVAAFQASFSIKEESENEKEEEEIEEEEEDLYSKHTAHYKYIEQPILCNLLSLHCCMQ